MMPDSCAVDGCQSNYRSSRNSDGSPKTVSVFKLPKDPLLRNKWLKFINRKNFTPTIRTKVCILHFEKRFMKRRKDEPPPPPLERFRPRILCSKKTVERTETVEKPNRNDDELGMKAGRVRLTPDAYPTIKPKGSFVYLKKKVTKNNKSIETPKIQERRTLYKYPRQCEMCLECFNNNDSFQKHIKTHKQTATSDKQVNIPNENDHALTNQNSDLDFEVIENNDSDDLFMFSESEGEEEEDIKCPITPQQLLDAEHVLDEPAIDLKDLCRVCGKKELKMIQIYAKEGRKIDLGLKMNQCLPIKVNENDSLPLSVCQRCVTRVEENFDLSSTCQKTDVMLTEMLAQQTMLLENTNFPTEESNPPFSYDDERDNLSRISMSESNGTVVATISVPPINSEPFDSLSRASSVSLDDADSFASMETENIFQDMVQVIAMPSSHDAVNESPPDEVKVLQCPKCEHFFVTFKPYEEHMLKSHELYVCKNHLEFETNSKEEFKNHKKECSLKQHLCPVCGKTYELNTKLKHHMKIHGERTFFCEICGKSFYYKSDLAGHKAVHDPIGKFTCLLCDKHFRHRRNMLLHERTVHCKSMTYICSMCDKSYSNESEIQDHCCFSHSPEERSKCTISVYTKKSDFQCDICQKYYDSSQTLKYHQRAHKYKHKPKQRGQTQNSDKQYQCDFCKKSYRGKGHLMLHIGKHIGTLYFKCDYCTNSFTYAFELKEHLNVVHLKTIKFPCQQCDKSFLSKRKLWVHIRTVHLRLQYKDKKDLDCSVCNKTFLKRYSLMVHMRIHNGERPFKCKYCDKAFRQSGDRNKHEKNLHEDK